MKVKGKKWREMGEEKRRKTGEGQGCGRRRREKESEKGRGEKREINGGKKRGRERKCTDETE